MKLKYTNKTNYNSDTTTYMLIGFVLLTVLLGALKILFF
jgi:hypothetical protein